MKYKRSQMEKGARLIQKYLKGKLVFDRYKDVVHNRIIEKMTAHFRKVR